MKDQLNRYSIDIVFLTSDHKKQVLLPAFYLYLPNFAQLSQT